MIFHENSLLADYSHEISYLIVFENWERCLEICCLLHLRLALKGLKLLSKCCVFKVCQYIFSSKDKPNALKRDSIYNIDMLF